MTTLTGRRIRLRPLVAADFPAWREVRRRNADWLTPWEPARTPGMPDVVESREAFAMRCSAREREHERKDDSGQASGHAGHSRASHTCATPSRQENFETHVSGGAAR